MQKRKTSLVRPVHVAISVALGLAVTFACYYAIVVPQLAANSTTVIDEILTGKQFSAITRDVIYRENQIKVHGYAVCSLVLPFTIAVCIGAFAAAARHQHAKASEART